MLKRLTIEQFVIIDKLSLNFQSALTVLTGETGAGKSILLDTMGLILGDPPNRNAVRQGADRLVIEAQFAPPSIHPIWTFLAAHELPVPSQEALLIRRTIYRTDGDEILLNGKTVPLDLLKKVGSFLVEIHDQFANQNLLDPSNQLTLLDSFGNFPQEIFKNVADALHDVQRYTKELELEKAFHALYGHELRQIDLLINEFSRLGIKEGLYENTKTELNRLLTARDTSESFQSILAQLVAGSGAIRTLASANDILAQQKHLDKEKLGHLINLLSNALENTRAAADEMRRLAPDYVIDTRPIRQHEEMLNSLQKIVDEHKVKPEDLFTFYEETRVKFKRLANAREEIAKLEGLLENAKFSYLQHARALTEKRREAGKALSEAITAELPPLKLMHAEFAVRVEEIFEMPWTELGLNRVTFMAQLNPGTPLTPIVETASGGELARLILALKVVLQRVQTIPTLVFDEVDSGIGGATAAAVGERIARLASSTQVLVVTHSPQVAARGSQHLHVSKETDGLTTISIVKELSLDERIGEISRMLAGEVSTVESQAAAKRLIDEANQAAQSRLASPKNRTRP